MACASLKIPPSSTITEHTMPESKRYTIPAELMQGIISTLAGLPWGQVNQLMSAIQQEVAQQEQAPAQVEAQTNA